MKRKIIIAFVFIMWIFSTMAQEQDQPEQDKKVAIFDPAGDVSSTIKEIVREEISSVIVNTKGFTVLERQLINKVLEENKFQMGGLVDESQISEIGKRIGANYVLVSTVSPLDKNYYISCKMIEVTTARIERQRTIQTNKGMNDLVEATQKVVKGMFDLDIISPASKQTGKSSTESKSKSTKTSVTEPYKSLEQNLFTSTDGLLVADGKNVFSQGKKLNEEEVKSIMINTDALRLYEKGLSRYKNGKKCLITGGCLIVAGILVINDSATMSDIESKISQNNNGTIISVVGIGLGITGFVLKSNGKKNIRAAVDSYNRNSYTSNIEIDFGLTQNGLGFVLRF